MHARVKENVRQLPTKKWQLNNHELEQAHLMIKEVEQSSLHVCEVGRY
jgi:hypothetical protein